MHSSIYTIFIFSCVVLVVIMEISTRFPSIQQVTAVSHFVNRMGSYGIPVDCDGLVHKTVALGSNCEQAERNHPFPKFSVIIVTYNEPLLNKT